MFSRIKIINRLLNMNTSAYKNVFVNHKTSLFNRTILTSNISNANYQAWKMFHTSTINLYKIFKNNENNYAHNVLKHDGGYDKNLIKNSCNSGELLTQQEFYDLLENNWKKESLPHIVEAFKKVSDYSQQNDMFLSNIIFDNLVEALLMNCRNLTDEQLSDLLLYLKKWPEEEEISIHNFGDVWSALDDVCLERRKNWSVDQMLYFADHWFNLNLSRIGDYTKEALYTIGRKPKSLTPKQFVQLMFYINICRRKDVPMFDLEFRFGQCIPELSMDEIAVVCMGFFKTKTFLRDQRIVSTILDRLLQEADTINEVTLAAILKICRGSNYLNLDYKTSNLLNVLYKEIDRLSILCCIQIALLGTNVSIFNPKVLTKICKKILDNIEMTRLKDLERVALVVTLYNFNSGISHDFFQYILEELNKPHRNDEINQYPKSFVSLIHYLCWNKIYPLDLVNKILSPEFLKNTYQNRGNYGREILVIDSSLYIDVPGCNSYRLDLRTRETLTKKYSRWFPRPGTLTPFTDRLLDEIYHLATELQGGNEFVHTNHLLPHFERADIVICNDKNGNPVNISHAFDKFNLSDVKNTNELDIPGVQWYAIIAGGWNMFIRYENRPLGTLEMKIRQLQTIGYIPILIEHFKWTTFSEEQKKEYILEHTRKKHEKCILEN